MSLKNIKHSLMKSFLIITLIPLLCASVQADTARSSETSRVSVSSDGVVGNDWSGVPVISADGRYVVFESLATNLVPDDNNGYNDIFVHDRQTGETSLVSVASSGAQANYRSHEPAISADGRYVAFRTHADNLVPIEPGYGANVFVHDRLTGQTSLVSVPYGDVKAFSAACAPDFSADGRYIAFLGSEREPQPGNGIFSYWDVYVHDQQTGVTEVVSTASDGTRGNAPAGAPAISADGRYVAFDSGATNLVTGDVNGVSDVFIHDRLTGETNLLSVNGYGEQANGESFIGGISADGRFVVFQSVAYNLGGDVTNRDWDIFVHDTYTGETTIVSVPWGGGQGTGSSGSSDISADGRYVVFSSWADNLVPGDVNGLADIFVYDRHSRETSLVSLTSEGLQTNDNSFRVSISADGSSVAYESGANNIMPGGGQFGLSQVYVRERPNDWLLMYYMAGDNSLSDTMAHELMKIFKASTVNADIAIFEDLEDKESYYHFFSSSGERQTVNLHEQNSGDWHTLRNFMDWAQSQSSAEKTALIIDDHGHPLSGLALDEDSGMDWITVKDELAVALYFGGPINVLFLNTCLMANLEVLHELRGSADYIVASESVEWGPFYHSEYLTEMSSETSPEDLALLMGHAYEDQFSARILSDGRNYTPSTISVIDATKITRATAAANNLAKAIRNASIDTKIEVWTLLNSPSSQLQRFDDAQDENWINDYQDVLADLYHMAEICRAIPILQAAADDLLATKDDFILYTAAWSGYPQGKSEYADYRNAKGISVSLPSARISFYQGQWLSFAQGADWNFESSSAPAQIDYEESLYWGAMISDLVAINNPTGPDNPEAPGLVEKGGVLNFLYLPMITR